MPKCSITGKSWMNGHKISHSNIKTKKRFKANIQKKRIFDTDTNKFITLKISTKALKTLNKTSLSKLIKNTKS